MVLVLLKTIHHVLVPTKNTVFRSIPEEAKVWEKANLHE